MDSIRPLSLLKSGYILYFFPLVLILFEEVGLAVRLLSFIQPYHSELSTLETLRKLGNGIQPLVGNFRKKTRFAVGAADQFTVGIVSVI